jgi:hypothetical protein
MPRLAVVASRGRWPTFQQVASEGYWWRGNIRDLRYSFVQVSSLIDLPLPHKAIAHFCREQCM